jgi:methionyl-tRNA synthetase
VYEWFNIDFDYFGRTTTQYQTKIAQDIFAHVNSNGYLQEDTMEQLFCEKDDRYLADRFVEGICPHCAFADARGDQCDGCGKLLNPTELKAPRCKLCGTTPILKSTKHLFLDLPKLSEKLENWVGTASSEWTNNSTQITRAWLKDGLKPRCITRDLKWGTPVPLPGYESKVFYVWFDAPIGYLSITANYTEEWEKWWKNPEDTKVELHQFMGKDNVPFHTVIFPSSLLATGQSWTMLKNLSTTEYLNYEGGKFSKSRGTGVFGDGAAATNIPADVWRYYLLANRPESSDADFSWTDLQLKNNSELADNLGNFVNRALKFAQSSFGNKVPELGPLTESETKLVSDVNEAVKQYSERLEKAQLREGARLALAVSRLGNQYLQENKPWDLFKTDKVRCGTVIATFASLARLVAILIWPYMPEMAANLLYTQLNLPREPYPSFIDTFTVDLVPAGHILGEPQPLFRKILDAEIKEYREKFGGATVAPGEPFPVDLRIGKVTSVADHPGADTLYLLKVDLGTEQRTVVAGVKSTFTKEQLTGRQVVLCCNLKPTKFKGETSEGMLLAAIKGTTQLGLLGPSGADAATAAPAGTLIHVGNMTLPTPKTPKFDGKKVKGLPFQILPDGAITFKDIPLTANNLPIRVIDAGDWSGARIQ